MTIFACPLNVTFDIPVIPPAPCDCPPPSGNPSSNNSVTSPKQFFIQMISELSNEYNGENKNEC